jgi:hypothetical protein
VPLSEVLATADEGRWAAPGFQAWVRGSFADGSRWASGALPVTAVLERTAVVELEFGDRRLARHDVLLVDPATIEWRQREAPASLFRREPRDARTPDAAPGELGTAASPAVPITAQPTAVQDTSPRRCGRCDRELPGQNRSGVCVSCQRTCPTCSGPKSIPSPQCRRCGRSRVKATTDAGALSPSDLVACVQDLLDQVVGMGRYASELENELARYRAELRRARRIGRRAQAAVDLQHARKGGVHA